LHGGVDARSVQGLYHLTSSGETSWCGFARAILEHSGLDCRITPIPTSDYPAPAVRPAYSVLDNSKIRDAFGIQLPDWRWALQRCMDDLPG
jgi:dTDP-4-dehydrorhamnose reductase